jgi:dUTP pyrophosphatase
MEDINMGFREAKNTWANFGRQLVGKSKQFDVRVKRNDAAKQYPLLKINKAGDVGFDLAATEKVTVPALTPEAVAKLAAIDEEYSERLERAQLLGVVGAQEALRLEWDEVRRSLLPRAVIPTGVFLDMPSNCWCSIEARSSASTKFLITPDAIIDAGYRGELFGVVFNLGYEPYEVQEGERVVQCIFHERVIAHITEVDELSASERGETGFGSSGKLAQKI